MEKLIRHFRSVIDKILDGSWLHYSEAKQTRGPGRVTYSMTHLEQHLVMDKNPRSFLMEPHTIRARARDAREQVARSFRQFDFHLYTAALSEHFGPEVCKELGSGIDEIVPPPVRGRRRKPRLQVQEGKGACGAR